MVVLCVGCGIKNCDRAFQVIYPLSASIFARSWSPHKWRRWG